MASIVWSVFCFLIIVTIQSATSNSHPQEDFEPTRTLKESANHHTRAEHHHQYKYHAIDAPWHHEPSITHHRHRRKHTNVNHKHRHHPNRSRRDNSRSFTPSFDKTLYVVNVPEEQDAGFVVTKLTANDPQGSNLIYSISAILDIRSQPMFAIDPTTGVVTTTNKLDREFMDKHYLRVTATTTQIPPRSATTTLQVKVTDENDHSPVFPSDKLQFYVPENSPIGYVVGEIRAFDPDEGDHSKIEYSIIGGLDATSFSLQSRPGVLGTEAELVTRTDLDYESNKKTYYIIVRASSHPLFTDTNVEIIVTDVNDNSPLLNDFSIIFNNYKNHFPTTAIGKVPVFDADVGDTLKYRITSGNNANLIFLNESSGEIKLSPNLNTNVPTRAQFEVVVTDGINRATAQCKLFTNLVTEAMLFNSITLRLNRVTRKDFLSSVYDRFLEGLSAVIPAPKEAIVIFNIQEDQESKITSILNVSFSIRAPGERDLDSFIKPQYVQERIYLSRTILARGTGLEILPFDDTLCIREPCSNFEECLSVLKFEKAGDFISSDTILFRPIYPFNTFACRCPRGFSGMLHKFECDVEVNLCYSNPCQNGGECKSRESGYSCICREGFVGKNCEINHAIDDCRNDVCRGSSQCSQGSKYSSDSRSTVGFQCVNCTQDSWSTSLCELRARSFSRGSYLTFHSLTARNRLNIKLRFATKHDNVLLLYNGRYNEKHDFLALEIVDSVIIFTYSLGDVIGEVSIIAPDGYLTDGMWHSIEVNYFNRTTKLKFDECDEAVGRKQTGSDSFVCSNSTVLQLEPRCRDRMQTCYRFLDLTGPLQIGGLPPLPTRFQTRTSSFVGCISDVKVDDQLLDLNTFVANNGTHAGCSEKRGFCQSFPCKNRGKCKEGWGSYICECPDGYTGEDCSVREDVVKNFRGDGFLTFTPQLRPLKLNWLVQISFKTFEPNGLLMTIHLGTSNQVILDIVNGRARYTYNSESLWIPEAKVNDGKWHTIVANWMINGIWLSLDHGQYESNRELSGDINGMYISRVHVGGLESGLPDIQSNLFRVPSFNGCIQGVDVGFGKDSWLRPTSENNVIDNCTYTNQCLSEPCSVNSDCNDRGLGKYECVCHPSYEFVGSECRPTCELDACTSGSTCIPWNNSRGYRCECDPYHTGTYCEDPLLQTCPSNWWGRPICGPCTCDVERGYDDNCNKTTGECSCQTNHYQPLGSDTCLPCECYSVGSYTPKCDHLTGQCSCRPGVIGRRCETCASTFAEVTLKGCEVIYDGCPKSSSHGIWFPRTAFGQTAVEQCPPGSTGKSRRTCHENEGWLEPDIFECLSNSFSELADQLLVLEKDNSSLSTYLSIKVAAELKSAANSTKTLYGSDLFVTFKLLNLLMSHEISQNGFNLTHKLDRHFLPNIVDVTSKILDPSYVKHWHRIGASLEEGGPEHILKLFNSYSEVLIKNRQDTFTEPFELSSENVLFGMDTISTDELWDMSYIESVMNRSNIYLTASQSVYLDHSLPSESGLGVSLPKYNNFPQSSAFHDDVTKIIIPLKTLAVPTATQAIESSISRGSHKKNQKPTAVISYTIFRTLGSLLPETFDYISVRTRLGLPTHANTPLVNYVVKAANSTDDGFIDKNFHPKINFRLRVQVPEGRTNPRCVYWSFPDASSKKHISHEQHTSSNDNHVQATKRNRGRWSAKGCELRGVFPSQRLFSTYQYINCSCDRVAPVTVIMDIAPAEVVLEENSTQSLASYIGLLSSILILFTTFLTLSIIHGLRTNSNDIHRNIVLCLLLVNVLFLIALKLRDPLIQSEFPCKMVAISLQYFYICIFSWMVVEGIHLYRMMTEIRDINHGPMKFYYFVGYAVPAVIVALSVGVKADQYGNYIFCWLSIHEGIIWSMIGPILALSLLNIFVFSLAISANIRIKDTVSDFGNLRTLLWLSIFLLPILATNWMLAVWSVNDSLQDLSFLFYIVSFFTSLYLFVGYCLVNRRVRFNIKVTWCKFTGKKMSMADESLNVTLNSRYNSSPFTGFQARSGFGLSTSSETSRSTTTRGSSQTPKNGKKSRRGRRNRKKKHEDASKTGSQSESDAGLDLASSHSSDEEDGPTNPSSLAPTQNEINSVIQQGLSQSPVPHDFSDYVSRRTMSQALASERIPMNSNENYVTYSRVQNQSWNSSTGMNISNVSSANTTGAVSTISNLKTLAEAKPYNRANILAMTLQLETGPSSPNNNYGTSSPRSMGDNSAPVTENLSEESKNEGLLKISNRIGEHKGNTDAEDGNFEEIGEGMEAHDEEDDGSSVSVSDVQEDDEAQVERKDDSK